MYDRHKPIIKWYEYDASKLYKDADAEDVTEDSTEERVEETVSSETAEAAPEAGDDVSLTGDPSMDDEVARIMAAFSGAKQNSVDDVFAAMAAEEVAAGTVAGENTAEDNEDLISSICAPKQNTVDDLIMMARGG